MGGKFDWLGSTERQGVAMGKLRSLCRSGEVGIFIMEGRQTGKGFRALKLQDAGSLTPDHPDFFKPDVNLAVLTKYGRGIYIRHGNDERCSSFFATLGTIVNKLELSFGTEQ